MSSKFTVTVSGFMGNNALLASQMGHVFSVPIGLLPGELVPGNILEIVTDVGVNQEFNRRQKILQVRIRNSEF